MADNIISRSFSSLSQQINKWTGKDEEHQEGVVSQFLPELGLDLSNEELIKLKNNWLSNSTPYTKEILSKQIDNENYYKGITFNSNLQEKRPLADNEIFMAIETFIPEVTRANPDPLIKLNDEVDDYAELNKDIVVYRADQVKVRMKMKKVARFWALYYLGPIKIAWDEIENDFVVEVLRPQKLILDKDGVVEEGTYKGQFLGEMRRKTASKLVEEFPNKKSFIEKLANNQMGTELQYIEWWTNEFVFWTLENEVLDKRKNPHFNYEGEQIEITDEFGEQTTETLDPINHFRTPQMPYMFLSVFSLGKQPHDDTGLVEQNLPNQDRINKMVRQIDKNIDNMNNGVVISGDAVSKEQAAKVAEAVRRGGVIWVPSGSAGSAVARINSPSLPADVYNTLQTAKQDLASIFGTTGFTPQGIKSEESVRGKILIKGQTQGRNSAITEAIEQLYDRLYNWFIQMSYVYYEEEHLLNILKPEDVDRYLSMRKTVTGKLLVSIKEGSLIPKDPLTKRNEAVERFAGGSIDPLSYMEALDVSDPIESTKRLLLYQSDPIQYAEELGIPLPQAPQQLGGGGAIIPPDEEAIPPEQQVAENPLESNILSAVNIEQ